jgi:hypothetical protein
MRADPLRTYLSPIQQALSEAFHQNPLKLIHQPGSRWMIRHTIHHASLWRSRWVFHCKQLLQDNQAYTPHCIVLELLYAAIELHNQIDHTDPTLPSKAPSLLMEADQAILLGDFMYTLAFQQMLTLKDPNILHAFAIAMQTMAEAELEIQQAIEAYDLPHLIQGINQKSMPLFTIATQWFKTPRTAMSEALEQLAICFSNLCWLDKLKRGTLLLPATALRYLHTAKAKQSLLEATRKNKQTALEMIQYFAENQSGILTQGLLKDIQDLSGESALKNGV